MPINSDRTATTPPLRCDGVPDLWAVTPAGIATAYVVSDLANGSEAITAGMPQKLT